MFDHFCRNTGNDNIIRNINAYKAASADNRIFSHCHTRHDNTVASDYAILF